MKHNAILVVTSLLSILLLTLHVTDDIVRGISKAEPSNTALLVLVVFLYGTLVLAERRSGHVIMLLVGLFAAGKRRSSLHVQRGALADSRRYALTSETRRTKSLNPRTSHYPCSGLCGQVTGNPTRHAGRTFHERHRDGGNSRTSATTVPGSRSPPEDQPMTAHTGTRRK